MISEKLTLTEKRNIDNIDGLILPVEDAIVYFKVTDNRVHIYYYWNNVKFLCSFAKPTGLFNQFIPRKVYLLKDVYE